MIKPSIAKLTWRRRAFGMTAVDRAEAKELLETHNSIDDVIEYLKYCEDDVDLEEIDSLQTLQAEIMQRVSILVDPDPQLYEPLPQVVNKHVTIDMFEEDQCYQFFRFKKEQLQKLKTGLHFPNVMTSQSYRYSVDEILQAGLFRLASPNRLGDAAWVFVFGWDQPRCSFAVDLFIDFMVIHWMYLVEDNVDFWKPYVGAFSEAIRRKLQTLGNYHNPVHEFGGFNIFGFIDCTPVRTCRPGGGPTMAGVSSSQRPQHSTCFLQWMEEKSRLQMANRGSSKWNEFSCLGASFYTSQRSGVLERFRNSY